MSFYNFSGYALDNGEPRVKISETTQPLPAKSEANMENFLNDAWAALSEAFNKLELAKQAQEEDDNNDEELNREKEGFVERIGLISGRVGDLQSDISAILYEHNNQN